MKNYLTWKEKNSGDNLCSMCALPISMEEKPPAGKKVVIIGHNSRTELELKLHPECFRKLTKEPQRYDL